MTYETRRVSLIRGNEVYIIEYNLGRENEAIETMAKWATNSDLNFDWLDAAVLCYQIGRRIENEISDRVERDKQL